MTQLGNIKQRPALKNLDGYKNYHKLWDSAHDTLESMIKPQLSTPIECFPMLTDKIGGLRPNEYTILCGATGAGKTQFCANITASLIRQKVPSYIASVETGPNDYLRRIFSVFNGKDWNTGDIVPLDEVKSFMNVNRSLFEFSDTYLALYEDRCSVEQLMSDILDAVENHGVRVAIIDNLNFFMEVTRSADSIIEMDRVIHELIIFCKKVPVHIIMVQHPKKTEHGRVLSEFDIKGSSTAVQEAHNVLLFNRLSQNNSKQKLNKEMREIKLAKIRRKGKHTGETIVFECAEGVRYSEFGELGETSI